jgi:ABC-2 type transport system permease protein
LAYQIKGGQKYHGAGRLGFMKILDALKYYASAGSYMMKLNLQGQMEYPSFLIGWFLSNMLQFGVGFGTLRVITIQFQNINGWEFNQIAFLYGLGIISHALSVIIFIQTWYIDGLVIHGEFDRMLLRPMNIYFQFCFHYINLIGLTDMLPGIIIFIYGAVTVGFTASILNISSVILVIIGATMIRGGIYTLVGSVGFWTKGTRSLTTATENIFVKSIMYPMTIYNRTIQAIFTFLLPVGFISFYPASGFLGKDAGFEFPGYVPLWTLGTGILVMVIAWRVFNMGLKRYDSAGN